MEFRVTIIETPTIQGIKKVCQDYEVMLVTILDAVLDRYKKNQGYHFIDTKLNLISGIDFDLLNGVEKKLKGRGTIYSWIQGRGLESLAGHADWLSSCSILTDAEKEKRCSFIKVMLQEVMTRMEEIRAKNHGHLFFTVSPDGQALEIDDNGQIKPINVSDEACNFSDLFYSKGLFASAKCLGLEDIAEQAKDYFRRVLHDIETGKFYSDQQAFDPKNKVRPIPGQKKQAPWMITLGGFALFVKETGEEEWLDGAERFLNHIIDNYINHGQFKQLEEFDFLEAIDENNQPWIDGGKVLSDAGHVLEFIGLATKVLLLMESKPDIPPRRKELLEKCRILFPKVFVHNFHNSFNKDSGGIYKALDLISKTPINDDMPWFSLPETIRAAILLAIFSSEAEELTDILQILADCSNVFLQKFVNRDVHLMAYQTRNYLGEPIDTIPAMPDADPGYHTGLSIIDFLNAVSGGNKNI